jgi:hypothetical protein
LSLLVASFLTPAFSYEDVKVDKIITLADRSLEPTLLRIDKEKQWWTVNSADNSLIRLAPNGTVSFRFPSGKKGLFKIPTDFDFFADGSIAVLDANLKKVLIIAGVQVEKGGETKLDWSKGQLTGQFPVENGAALAVSHDDIIAHFG